MKWLRSFLLGFCFVLAASFPASAQYRVVASCPGVTDFQPSGSSGGIPVVDTKGNACAGASTGSAVNLNQISGVSANLVSTANSSIATLGNGGVFTGTAEDISAYASVTVSLFADQASATNGLSIQQSADGTNWDMADIYTVPASTGKTFGVQVAAKFLRVVYTNGATPQSAFRLQTIMHGFMPVTTSQRPADAFSNENDFAETMAFEMVFNGTTWDRRRGDTLGANVQPIRTTTTMATAAPTALTFGTLLASNTARRSCMIQNTGATTGYVYFGANGSATTSNSFVVGAGGTISCTNSNVTLTDNVAGTCASGTCAFIISSQ